MLCILRYQNVVTQGFRAIHRLPEPMSAPRPSGTPNGFRNTHHLDTVGFSLGFRSIPEFLANAHGFYSLAPGRRTGMFHKIGIVSEPLVGLKCPFKEPISRSTTAVHTCMTPKKRRHHEIGYGCQPFIHVLITCFFVIYT